MESPCKFEQVFQSLYFYHSAELDWKWTTLEEKILLLYNRNLIYGLAAFSFFKCWTNYKLGNVEKDKCGCHMKFGSHIMQITCKCV